MVCFIISLILSELFYSRSPVVSGI